MLYEVITVELLETMARFRAAGADAIILEVSRITSYNVCYTKLLREALLQNPEYLLGGILVGNNLVNIAISVFATGLFVQLYGDRGEYLTILLLTPVLLIFSEVLPKSYAAKQSEALSFVVLRPIGVVLRILRNNFV